VFAVKILVVEDDQNVALILKLLLSSYSYAVDIGADGETGLQMVDAFEYDLVVLDILLPGLDGISLCQQIRAKGLRVPILLLTGQADSKQKAIALNAGADDYVVKPFDPEELMARVQALLRRGGAVNQPVLVWGHLCVDPSSRKVNYGSNLLALTPKELAILELFLRHNQQVFSARAILDHAWSSLESPGEEAIRVHIKELRQKLTAAGAPKDFIKTVYRVGYRLNPLYSSALAIETKEPPGLSDIAELKSVNHELRAVLEELQATQAQLRRQNTELEIAYQRIGQELQQRQQIEQKLQAAHDQLEQQVAERTAELVQANSQLNLFFSQSLDGFFFMMLDQPIRWDQTIDKDAAIEYAFAHQRMIRVNDAILAQYNCDRQQFLGLTPADLFAHDLEHAKTVWQQFFDTGHLHVETNERKFDGSSMVIEGDYICMYDQAGRITGHFGIQRDISDRARLEAERKQAEIEWQEMSDALRESEAKYRSLFESIYEGFCTIEVLFDQNQKPVDYRFLQVNSKFEQQTGIENAVGRRIREIAPQHEDYWFEIFSQVALTGEPVRFENYAAELHRWYEVYAFPIENPEWHHLGILFNEISDRKWAAVILRESEQRFRSAFDYAAIGMSLVATDGRWLQVNQAQCEIVGYSESELQATTFQAITHPEDLVQDLEYTRQLLAREIRTFQMEKRYIHKLGHWVWVLLSVSMVYDPQDQPLYFIAQVQDISDRKRLEAERQQAEQKIREQAALIDIATDAIYVCDLQGRILFWNYGAEQLYGWTAKEALGQEAGKMLRLPDLSDLTADMNSLLKTGFWQGEPEKVTKAGKKIVVASRWTLMRNQLGQPKSILIVNTDITAKKQLETQFHRAQRLESLGTLTSGIAHDLNNILTPIVAISQLMRMTQPDLNERSQEMLAMLENSAKRGTNLVKQIVTFARGTEGRQIVLQVRPLLLEVSKILEQTWPKSIQIRTATSPNPLGMVYADPTQLHQVLMNLCVNARDAMPNGGVLTLSAENRCVDDSFAQLNLEAQVGDYVVITVSDTGSGISPAVRDRIFEPFFTCKAPGQGTGLGLSTVLGIVKSYGGFVQVHSQVGEGTQFSVYLPTTEDTTTENQPAKALLLGQGQLVLIVDDDVDVQRTNQALLESYCYKTLIANDGLEAIAIYAQQQDQIKVVLIDIMMPKMDGITAVRRLRKLNSQVKIIAISGLSSNRAPVLAAGANLFLAKPYATEDLLSHLYDLIMG
jgi:PAS domain S-box-containing protein